MCETMNQEENGKKPWGVPEYIKDNDFPALPKDVAEALGVEEHEPRIPLPDIRTLIKVVGKRKNAVIILKFFCERNDSYNAVDVGRALKSYMAESTVRFNIDKLCNVGLMKAVKIPALDKHTTYYSLVNKKVAELIVKDALNRVSYILGHFIPYSSKIRVSEIKEDKRFVGKARYYGLSIDEAVDLVKSCPHIEVEYSKGITLLSRNCQGYIEPGTEVEKETVEVGEAEEVE